MAYSKIHPIALALTTGVLSGSAATFVGLMAYLFYTGKPFVAMMGSMYVSYNPSLMNCALGGLGVGLNVFIATYVVVWIYNFLIDYI